MPNAHRQFSARPVCLPDRRLAASSMLASERDLVLISGWNLRQNLLALGQPLSYDRQLHINRKFLWIKEGEHTIGIVVIHTSRALAKPISLTILSASESQLSKRCIKARKKSCSAAVQALPPITNVSSMAGGGVRVDEGMIVGSGLG